MDEIIRDQAQGLRELINKPQGLKFISVASGKGGVGKSSISVNLAITLSSLGHKVLLLDADFGLANVDVMLGVTSRYNVSHFLRGEKALSEIIQLGYGGVSFISGGSGVLELLNMDDTQLERLISGLTELAAPISFIICDLGAGISDSVIKLILASTETLIVTTPEPTSILDAYALVKTVVRRDKTHPLRVVMNKCENRTEGERVLAGFGDIVQKHLGKEIQPLGFVRYDHNVVEAIKRQVPVAVRHPDGMAARDIMAVARALLELPYEPPTNRLSRLFARILTGR